MLEATDDDWHHLAVCRAPEHDTALWFPQVDADREDDARHSAEAKRLCAGCPVLEECLVGAIERKESFGIWGGAGDSWRRVLARAYLAGGERWETAWAEHVARLDGSPGNRVNSNGAGATHGLPSTYARGCRCRPCRLAISERPRRVA